MFLRSSTPPTARTTGPGPAESAWVHRASRRGSTREKRSKSTPLAMGKRADPEVAGDVGRRGLADGKAQRGLANRPALTALEEGVREGLDVVDGPHQLERAPERTELEKPVGGEAILGVMEVVHRPQPGEVLGEFGRANAHQLCGGAGGRRRGNEAKTSAKRPKEAPPLLVERIHGHVAARVVERVGQVRGVHHAAARHGRIREEAHRQRGHEGPGGPKPVNG